MTVGLSTAHAHGLINILRGTSYTGITPYVQLHTGDPGSAGTANASAETERKAVTFAAPSAGSSTASAVSWASWDAGSETITHCSLFDAATDGNFIQSGTLAASKDIENGDTLNLTLTASYTPIAA